MKKNFFRIQTANKNKPKPQNPQSLESQGGIAKQNNHTNQKTSGK